MSLQKEKSLYQSPWMGFRSQKFTWHTFTLIHALKGFGKGKENKSLRAHISGKSWLQCRWNVPGPKR